MRSPSLGRLLGSLLATVFIAGCGAMGAPSVDTGEQGYISGPGIVSRIPPAQRQPLPRITGRLLDGGHFDSRDHVGEVVVYNVWGSWCPPCRKEAPTLQEVWERTRHLGVQFVGIDVKDNDAAARAFERSFGITYPSIATEDSSVALLNLSTSVPPNAIPSTIVVARQGRVAGRILGQSLYTDLHELVVQTATEHR